MNLQASGPTAVAAAAILAAPMILSAQTAERTRLASEYGHVPLTFEANTGQTDPQVAFLARGAGYALFLTPREAVLSLRGGQERAGAAVLRMKWRGANPSPRVTGVDVQGARSNYFIGSDPARWRTNVPHFGKVRYEEVYRGIDLVYYGRQSQLEFDFVVKPGADPRRIGLDLEGAEKVGVDREGDLIVRVARTVLRQRRPVAYQERNGERQPVAVAYAVKGKRYVGFRLGAYDASRSLVIDPVLVYSTYLGGTGADSARDVAVDSSGNVYIAGYTRSADFPISSPLQGALAGSEDAFVAKLNVSGSALVYSTYLGGTSGERGYGIVVDGSGNAYVTGNTGSTNFPTVNALQGANGGGSDAFVAKLNPSGSALVYSTYLGGLGGESATAIAVDGFGDACVTGATDGGFPTANAIQGASGGGVDAFVTKLNSSGSAMIYSTYLGGSGNDQASGVAADVSGNAYVTGYTSSTNFPTVNALQGASAGGGWDAFVAKLNPAGSAMVFSTYLGGSGSEDGWDIAADGLGNAYVAGRTNSSDFPTVNAIQGAQAGGGDFFVTKLNASGSALIYSTYLGGSYWDYAYGVAVDGSGNAYVTGDVDSWDFPTASPIQAAQAGGGDIVVVKLNASGSSLAYSTYLGGSGYDGGYRIAADVSGNAYIAGPTGSTDFPTANAFQAVNAGSGDAFVVKILDDVIFRNGFE